MSWNQPASAVKRRLYGIVVCLCFFCLYGCSVPDLSGKSLPGFDLDIPLIGEMGHNLAEVSPPDLIQALKIKLPSSAPTVEILEPADQSTIDHTDVEIQLTVSGLKLFKDSDLGLGPHIALIVDDQSPIEVYDVSHPIKLKDLRPGTHTVRAIAAYPWHESFKNASAYAQSSFNILTSSQSNDTKRSPILTTLRVDPVYTAEPMILDFIVRNGSPSTIPASSAVKATLNDQSFVVNEPDATLYLTGLQTGQNWLKLELQDSKGQLSNSPFSEQLFGFEYQPEKSSSLGQLLSGKLSIEAAGGIVGLAKPTPKPPVTPVIPKADSDIKEPVTPIKPTKTSSTTSTDQKASESKRSFDKTNPTPTPAANKNAPSSSPATTTPSAVSKSTLPPSNVNRLDTPKISPSIPNQTPVPPSSSTESSKIAAPQTSDKATPAKPDTKTPTSRLSRTSTDKVEAPPPVVKKDVTKPRSAIPEKNKTTTETNSKSNSAPNTPDIKSTDLKDNAQSELLSSPEDDTPPVNQGLKNWRDRFRQIKQEATSQSELLNQQSSFSLDSSDKIPTAEREKALADSAQRSSLPSKVSAAEEK